jgi:hypothetical protein
MTALKSIPFLLLAALTLAGCRLGQPGSASFASVTISNHSTSDIQLATAKVFQEDGYQILPAGPSQMLFQREGTRGQNIAYEGIGGTHYGAQTLVRVRASLVDFGNGSFRLQCQAYIVTDAGDKFLQEEQPLSNVSRGPYQALLNKVKSRLD